MTSINFLFSLEIEESSYLINFEAHGFSSLLYSKYSVIVGISLEPKPLNS